MWLTWCCSRCGRDGQRRLITMRVQVARRAALVVAAGRLHHWFVYVEFGRRRWRGKKLTAPPTQWLNRPRLVPTRGAYHDRHDRGAGCGGRGSVGRVIAI